MVVDVGADYGFTTTYFASEVGPEGAHDLVIEPPVEVVGQAVIDYFDEATERFRQTGRTELHGILCLHAAQL